MPNTSSTWPGPGSDAVRPQDIRWETVRTEEEEYLDKLQSKLSRVMKGGFQDAREENGHGLDPNELPDRQASMPQDDDPGLHLLYEFPSQGTDDESQRPSVDDQGRIPRSPKIAVEVIQDTPSSTTRPRLVRFRSRVRITSGVHPPPSTSSSTVGSFSSSISVPLRGQYEHDAPSTSAPLSDMLSSDAANAFLTRLSPARKPSRERKRAPASSRLSAGADERTPLSSAASSPSTRRSYTEPVRSENDEDDGDAELDRMRAAARKSEERVMFGKWPWRLLNRHWWWWKLEPIICCCARFDDESDLE